MQYFATIDTSIVPILGVFAGVIAGCYALATRMLNAATKEREAAAIERENDRKERKAFTKVLSKMASSNEKLAEVNKVNGERQTKALERSADEAKQRNGHLGDQNIQITELVVEGNRAIQEVVNLVKDKVKP